MPGAGLAGAFDRFADGYDESFTRTWIGRELREAVWSRLDRVFRAPGRLLELGCGTGEDALRLAGRGLSVVATDASARMIEVARRKAPPGAAGRVDFRHVPMEAIGSALGAGRFDGVLANFGVINCCADLPALVDTLAARLTDGAPLVWVVMGPFVPWEWAWYLGRGDWRRAGRRLRRGGVAWNGLTVRYPAPSRLRSLLERHFVVDRMLPLGVVLPPSYAAGWLERAPRTRAVLASLERIARHAAPLSWLADHYIVEARRRPALPAPDAPA